MKGCICKRTYHRTRGMKLQYIAENVRGGVFGNKDIFMLPPYSKATFTATLKKYTNARVAHDLGGSAKNFDYVVARSRLMDLIDEFADYVDKVANFNPIIINAAGFIAAYDPNKYRSRKEPVSVNNLVLKNHSKISGMLLSSCEVYPPRTSFFAILLEGKPFPEGFEVIDKFGITNCPPNFNTNVYYNLSLGRNKIFKGLIPGIRYYLYYVAYNNHGCSAISSCINVMCG